MNQLWWIGPALLLLGYGSRWLAKRRRSAAPRGNPQAVSEPRAAGALPDRPLLFISVRPKADEDSPALQAMDVDGQSIGLFGPGYGGAWSPDAGRFAFVAEAGLVVATLEGPPDVVVAIGENESLVSWPMWAPDGKKLAAILDSYSDDDDESVTSTLMVAEVDARKSVARYPISDELVSPFHTSPPNKFRWSPDGTSILISWESAAVIDLFSGRTHRLSWGPIVADWAPAGDGVYYLEAGKVDDPRNRRLDSFGRWDKASDSIERLLKRQELQRLGFAIHPGLVYGHMNLSPGGSRVVIVVGSAEAELAVVHVYDAGPRPLDLTAAHPSFDSEQPILAVEWAPDERSLAAVTLPGGDPLVRILDLDTGEWRTLTTLMLGLEGIDLIETVGLVKSLSWGT